MGGGNLAEKQMHAVFYQGRLLAECTQVNTERETVVFPQCFSPLRQLGLIQMFCYASGDVNPAAWRWGRGTPGNQSKLNYLSADSDKTISFLSSSQNVRGGEIKSVNIFNECNY